MIDMLFELTGQAALAIENTALFRNLKEKAMRDDLTGLFRSGFFYEEVKKGIENYRSSALISLDIDFFKSINDTFGHPAGDEVLKVTAQTLKKLLRAGDIACRMGGDEFMIFLPEVDSRHAYNISQRIIHYFLSHKIKIQDNENFMISLSAGVALYPSNADNFQELLNQSDAALYLSKQKGRGRVHMAQDLLD
jgi:diguanylate cyclase (GGDEF)-like protein